MATTKVKQEKEIWKDVPGYEGIYKASDLGRVKSLERIIKNNGGTQILPERIMNPGTNNNGYLHIRLSKDGKGKLSSVHQVVATTFLDHVPKGHKIVVDHIDNNPLNNRLDNLQIVSHRENSSKDKRNNPKYSSRFTGASYHIRIKKWISRIYINGKLEHLGYFDSQEQASKAYDKSLFYLNHGVRKDYWFSNPLRLFKIFLVLLLVSFSNLNAQISIEKEIPIIFSKGLPLVKMNINGTDRMLLLDTGSSSNSISLELKQYLGYESYKYYKRSVNSLGGDTEMHNVRYLVMKDNKGKIIDLEWNATDLTNVRQHINIVGILGSEFFKQGWLIDYKSKRLIKLSDNLIANK